eukprot:scaffold33537_cov21-Tisochrysis_lutea.AAC.3
MDVPASCPSPLGRQSPTKTRLWRWWCQRVAHTQIQHAGRRGGNLGTGGTQTAAAAAAATA